MGDEIYKLEYADTWHYCQESMSIGRSRLELCNRITVDSVCDTRRTPLASDKINSSK